MDRSDRAWAEAAARVQADDEADARDAARELRAVEASRMRLQDRHGSVRVDLRCGEVIVGELGADAAEAVDGFLDIREQRGGRTLVAAWAVVTMTGSHRGLRVEDSSAPAVRLSALLRETWSTGEPITALDVRGRWHRGSITWVGADHVEVVVQRGVETPALATTPLVLPRAAVEAWRL